MNTLALRAARPRANVQRQWQSFMAALSLEGLVVLAVVAWLAAHPSVVPERVTPLSIDPSLPEKLEPTPPLKQITPLPLPPIPTPKPQRSVPAPVPAQTLQSVPVPVPTPIPAPVSAPAPSPTPSPEPVAPQLTPNPVAAVKAALPPPPPQAPAMAPAIDPTMAYNAKLAAAVQAAFEVPATAAALNFKGRARVEFSLVDGAVSAIRVVQSSGLGAADRAALKAVQMAAFPPPPPALQGKPGSYQIWVACL